jgi:threonine dehydratase
VGRIVVGVQVPPAERSTWLDFLKGLSYEWVDESKNPVYQIFLGPVD